MKEIRKSALNAVSSATQSFALNTATQSRESFKEQTNIWNQGLLLYNLTFQI